MNPTSIPWTKYTWNPVVGCSLASPGCTNCYAMGEAATVNRRQGGLPPERRKYKGLVYRPRLAGCGPANCACGP
jgi:protein gp37